MLDKCFFDFVVADKVPKEIKRAHMGARSTFADPPPRNGSFSRMVWQLGEYVVGIGLGHVHQKVWFDMMTHATITTSFVRHFSGMSSLFIRGDVTITITTQPENDFHRELISASVHPFTAEHPMQYTGLLIECEPAQGYDGCVNGLATRPFAFSPLSESRFYRFFNFVFNAFHSGSAANATGGCCGSCRTATGR
jgi:hypothetical protein